MEQKVHSWQSGPMVPLGLRAFTSLLSNIISVSISDLRLVALGLQVDFYASFRRRRAVAPSFPDALTVCLLARNVSQGTPGFTGIQQSKCS